MVNEACLIALTNVAESSHQKYSSRKFRARRYHRFRFPAFRMRFALACPLDCCVDRRDVSDAIAAVARAGPKLTGDHPPLLRSGMPSAMAPHIRKQKRIARRGVFPDSEACRDMSPTARQQFSETFTKTNRPSDQKMIDAAQGLEGTDLWKNRWNGPNADSGDDGSDSSYCLWYPGAGSIRCALI